jgi:hypothetical protein
MKLLKCVTLGVTALMAVTAIAPASAQPRYARPEAAYRNGYDDGYRAGFEAGRDTPVRFALGRAASSASHRQRRSRTALAPALCAHLHLQ